jgi:hypothetical protein
MNHSGPTLGLVLLSQILPAASGAAGLPGFATIEVDSIATEVLGDIDRSGAVDARELTRLLTAWGTGDPIAALDGDGIVAAADFAQLFENCSHRERGG